MVIKNSECDLGAFGLMPLAHLKTALHQLLWILSAEWTQSDMYMWFYIRCKTLVEEWNSLLHECWLRWLFSIGSGGISNAAFWKLEWFLRLNHTMWKDDYKEKLTVLLNKKDHSATEKRRSASRYQKISIQGRILQRQKMPRAENKSARGWKRMLLL